MSKLITNVAVFGLLIQKLLQFGLGVDYGSEFHKSAMIIPGKFFKMVENQISKKKTPTTISFCDGDRFFEYQGLKKRLKKKCDSFSYTTRFLHNRPENDEMETDLYLDKTKIIRDDIGYLLEVSKNNLPKSLNFTRMNEDESAYLLRAEELNAMIMENNLKNAQRTGETVFKDVVVTIPSNDLSIEARKRIKAMNELAGLKTLAFVHENTAAAVYQRIDAKAEDESQNVLFVNIGSYGVKLSLVNYGTQDITKDDETSSFPAVTVIEDMFTNKVSGYRLDKCLSEYAIDKHMEGKKNEEELRSKINLYKQRRIVTEIKKAKEVLGVNKNYVFKMEDYFDYMPLSAKVQREEFETKCDHVFIELTQILEQFKEKLEGKGYKQEDIHAIEIIGGSVRVPKVQGILKNFYNMKLHTRINGDEGPALGASFLAANYSIGMRTKKIILNEGPNYNVNVTITFKNDTGFYKEAELFPYKTNAGSKKSFGLPSLKEDVLVKLVANDQGNYEKEYLIEGAFDIMENFEGKNITEYKGVFNLELDLLGIPQLSEVNLLVKENITEIRNVTVPLNETETDLENGFKNSTNATNETDIIESVDATNSTNSTNTTKSANETVTTVTREEVTYKTKIHKKKLRISVINESYKSLLDNKDEMKISKKLMRGMNTYEEQKKERSRLKNELEGFIYKLRNTVNEKSTAKYLNEEEKKEFLEKSEELDEYFFSDEMMDADVSLLKNKTKEIETFMYQFNYRRHEHKERSKLYASTLEILDKSLDAIDKIKKLRSWLPEESILETQEKVNKTKTEVLDLYEEQLQMRLDQNPVFTTSYVREKVEDIDFVINKLRRMEKPKKKTNSTTTAEDLDSLREEMKNMNFDGMNFDQDKLNDLLKKMKNLNITGEDGNMFGMGNSTFNIPDEVLGGDKEEADIEQTEENAQTDSETAVDDNTETDETTNTNEEDNQNVETDI